jgi:WD repeat-containing protein mio
LLLCLISYSFCIDVRLSPNAAAYQLASFTDVTFVKCLAWLPSPQVEGFVAFGQTNGRVLLTSVLGNAESLSFNGIEYTSKHNRQCNALAWGVLDSNILAAGFDKHRSEYGILVWDVCKTGLDSAKPVVEFAFGEPTASLAWFNQSQTIVAGVNNKHLRVYDLRGNELARISRSYLHSKIYLINRWNQNLEPYKHSSRLWGSSGSFCSKPNCLLW